MIVGDIDGDGDFDFVVFFFEGYIWLLMNDGEGGFCCEVEFGFIVEGVYEFCSGYCVCIIDFDGDGCMEFVVNFVGELGSEKVFFGVVMLCCMLWGLLWFWIVVLKLVVVGG